MDNTTLNPGTGGDTIREVDKAGAKAQVVILDIGGAGAESLLTGALPVSVASLPLPTGAATSALQTQPGVDIGDVTINNAAGATAVNIQDGGNSITVDGTVTTSPPANASTNVAQLAGAVTSVNSGLKDGGTLRIVLATDQPQLTNKLLVTPDSVALPANQSVNVSQLSGTTTDTNSGVKSAGTLRIVLATDQPALTNKLLVTPDSVALPANQSVNVNQFAGTGAQTGSGTATGALRVELSNNGTGLLATVSAVTAITNALPTGTNSLGKISDITTSVVPGTAATNLGKAEDGAHTTADTGVFALGVRRDVPNLPTAATTDANNDYAAVATDTYGVFWTRKRQLVTYSASYRLADATAGQTSLTFTFVANTNKQLGSIYHAAASTKTVKLRKVLLNISTGAAGIFEFEIRGLSATTAPATGNPAITPRQHDPADAAVEATCLALPTTAGSLVGADTGTVSETFTWNSVAAAAAGNPSGLSGQDIVLYEYKDGMEMKPLTMRAANAEGFAVNGRCTQAVALRFTLHFIFSEE